MLAIDIGNSRIKAAVFEHGKMARTVAAPDARSLRAELREIDTPDAAAACSVRPSEDEPLRAVIRELFALPVAFLERELPAGLVVRCDEPHKIGADRLANAIAAYHHAGRAAIVVDCGSAIAFDVISDEGDFVGGVIAPGIGTSLDALHEKTALLPRVKAAAPAGAVGKDTVSAMLAGVVGGLPGLVDRVVENIRAELHWNFIVYATGGDSQWIAARSRTVEEVIPELTLEGLYLAWEKHPRQL